MIFTCSAVKLVLYEELSKGLSLQAPLESVFFFKAGGFPLVSISRDPTMAKVSHQKGLSGDQSLEGREEVEGIWVELPFSLLPPHHHHPQALVCLVTQDNSGHSRAQSNSSEQGRKPQ